MKAELHKRHVWVEDFIAKAREDHEVNDDTVNDWYAVLDLVDQADRCNGLAWDDEFGEHLAPDDFRTYHPNMRVIVRPERVIDGVRHVVVDHVGRSHWHLFVMDEVAGEALERQLGDENGGDDDLVKSFGHKLIRYVDFIKDSKLKD